MGKRKGNISKVENNIEWWQEEYGFFGSLYLEGDDSVEGYLQKRKQTLAQRTETEVKGVISLLGLQKGQRILDIPCGYGRHSIALAKQGFEVVGSDVNSVHLAKAEGDTRKAGLKVRYKKKIWPKSFIMRNLML
jgi:cyclopropane fatty-acyl-phospholipid synthase-like methyltransferase